MPIERAKLDLENTEAEIAANRAQLAVLAAKTHELEAKAQKLRDFIELYQSYVAVSATEEAPPPTPPMGFPTQESDSLDSPMILAPSSPFYGKGLAEAACVALRQIGSPTDVSHIATVLRGGGWKFPNGGYLQSIYWALRKRSISHGDVLSMPKSKWALSEWKLDNERATKSREGLISARARGVRLGPKPKIDPDKAEELLKQHIGAGEMANILGVSRTAMYKWLNNRDHQRPVVSDITKGLQRIMKHESS